MPVSNEPKDPDNGEVPTYVIVVFVIVAAVMLIALGYQAYDWWSGRGVESNWDAVEGGAEEPDSATTGGGVLGILGGALSAIFGAGKREIPKTKQTDVHAEVFDALKEVAAKGEAGKAALVWLSGPSAIGKTSLGYAARDVPIEGVEVLNVDSRVVRPMARALDPKEREALFAELYGEGSAKATPRSKEFISGLSREIAASLAKPDVRVVLIEGAVREGRLTEAREATMASGPHHYWVLVPAEKSKRASLNMAARIAFYATRAASAAERRAAKGDTAPPYPVTVPFTNAEAAAPVAELAKLSPAKIVAHPKVGPQIVDAVAKARAGWKGDVAAAKKAKNGRVFEV